MVFSVIGAVLYYMKDRVKEFVIHYDEAILVTKSHGTQVMVTMQIIVSLNNIHSLAGGSEFLGSYGSFIRIAQVCVFDFFELLHGGCTVKGDYSNKLFMSTLVNSEGWVMLRLESFWLKYVCLTVMLPI